MGSQYRCTSTSPQMFELNVVICMSNSTVADLSIWQNVRHMKMESKNWPLSTARIAVFSFQVKLSSSWLQFHTKCRDMKVSSFNLSLTKKIIQGCFRKWDLKLLASSICCVPHDFHSDTATTVTERQCAMFPIYVKLNSALRSEFSYYDMLFKENHV